jgi:hypothetical protein
MAYDHQSHAKSIPEISNKFCWCQDTMAPRLYRKLGFPRIGSLAKGLASSTTQTLHTETATSAPKGANKWSEQMMMNCASYDKYPTFLRLQEVQESQSTDPGV